MKVYTTVRRSPIHQILGRWNPEEFNIYIMHKKLFTKHHRNSWKQEEFEQCYGEFLDEETLHRWFKDPPMKKVITVTLVQHPVPPTVPYVPYPGVHTHPIPKYTPTPNLKLETQRQERGKNLCIEMPYTRPEQRRRPPQIQDPVDIKLIRCKRVEVSVMCIIKKLKRDDYEKERKKKETDAGLKKKRQELAEIRKKKAREAYKIKKKKEEDERRLAEDRLIDELLDGSDEEVDKQGR